MCLAEFAAYYYKDYKSDTCETIDSQPAVLSDDILNKHIHILLMTQQHSLKKNINE